jgi:hypothetical protein
MIADLSVGVARRVSHLDADLPDKVRYLLGTADAVTPRRRLGDPAITLAIASLIVACVGVAVQIVELLRKQQDRQDEARRVRERLEQVVERPSFLPEAEYHLILVAVAEEVASIGQVTPAEPNKVVSTGVDEKHLQP